MPAYHTIIDDIMVGADKSFRRIVNGVPPGLTIVQAWFTLKDNVTRTDAEAIAQKSITATATAAGQIVAAGSTGIADLLFHLLPTDTIRMTARVQYPYDIQVKLSNNKFYPVDSGLLAPQARVGQVSGV
jgi:hypothetical protein